jgi:hypothetical protein
MHCDERGHRGPRHILGKGLPWEFRALLDGADLLLVSRGGPYYLTEVPAGDHVVALVRGPGNCSVDPESQPVTLTAGRLVRDTVAVEFSVACTRPPQRSGFVRITAPTTGALPNSIRFDIWYDHYSYWGYGGTPALLGAIEPNGSLVLELPASHAGGGDPYWYDFWLRDVPSRCSVRPISIHTPIMSGETLDLEFALTC